jgi:hypothetical protein
MKLLFAYTGKAILNAGVPYPNALINVWKQAGLSPFILHQSSTNLFYATGDEMTFNIGFCHIYAHAFDIIANMAADEVITWGWRYRGTFSTASALPISGLVSNNPRLSVHPVTWGDCNDPTNTTGIRDIFIEVTLDPVARTVTGYVNGRKTRTMPVADGAVLNEVNFGFLNVLTSNSVVKSGSHFYAAIFKRTEGVTHLSTWECEDLVELSSELRDGDGNLTRNVVNEAWKSVVYKAPLLPADGVAVDGQLVNPQLYSKLITDFSDGATSATYTVPSVGLEVILDAEFGNTTTGKSVAGLSPSKLATQLTLKLKALPPQE